MNLPSIQYVLDSSGRTVRRFPGVLACAALAAAAGIVLVESSSQDSPWLRVLLSATLGLPLLVSVAVLAERRRLGRAAGGALRAAALLLLLGFFLASDPWLDPVLTARYVQLSLGLHLLAAFLPYAGGPEVAGFWQYNKRLLFRFLLSAAYAAVLFAGLAVALVAIDKLFGVDIDDDTYLHLWSIIAFVFTTWHFLAGVPRDFGALETSTDYPPGLRIFSQYILVPLVVVYLVILTAYFGRVLVTREWPSGWIGWLVSSVSVLGILALLLVHPVQDRPENRWVGTFSRSFHLALIPSILMLFVAIGKRIDQYGITENRYFLVTWAVWLLGITLYFIFSRTKGIRTIPSTLAVITFAVSFGPWGAYAVSERSQRDRLADLLEESHLLEGERVQPATSAVPFADREEISSVLRYLVEHHGTSSFEGWFQESLDGIGAPDTARADGPARTAPVTVEDRVRAIMDLLGLEYVERWQRRPTGRFRYHATREPAPLDIRPFEIAVRIRGLTPADSTAPDGMAASYDPDERAIVLREGGERLIAFPVESFLTGLAETAPKGAAGSGPSPERMRLRAENVRVRAMLDLTSIAGDRTPDRLVVHNLEGTAYLRYREGAP